MTTPRNYQIQPSPETSVYPQKTSQGSQALLRLGQGDPGSSLQRASLCTQTGPKSHRRRQLDFCPAWASRLALSHHFSHLCVDARLKPSSSILAWSTSKAGGKKLYGKPSPLTHSVSGPLPILGRLTQQHASRRHLRERPLRVAPSEAVDKSEAPPREQSSSQGHASIP